MNTQEMEKAARCGEPSYLWREGQQRRLDMILSAAGSRIQGKILENGCGVGMYMAHLSPYTRSVFGLDFDFPRVVEARLRNQLVIQAAGEYLPYPDSVFDVILSNEVIEHVADDRSALREMVRTLTGGGRLVLFCPNRGYPFETHGFFWAGRYHFGNIPFINWLPRRWRDRLAPHVRVYSRRDLERLFTGLPVKIISRTVIFGGYDNIIERFGKAGRILRAFLQGLEHTPLRSFGLSHCWIVERLLDSAEVTERTD